MKPRCTVVFNQVILVLVSYIEYINIRWPFADTLIINHSTINLVCIRKDTLRFSTAIKQYIPERKSGLDYISVRI